VDPSSLPIKISQSDAVSLSPLIAILMRLPVWDACLAPEALQFMNSLAASVSSAVSSTNASVAIQHLRGLFRSHEQQLQREQAHALHRIKLTTGESVWVCQSHHKDLYQLPALSGQR
jgi:hypothetical protein